jgi:hypothetical protein
MLCLHPASSSGRPFQSRIVRSAVASCARTVALQMFFSDTSRATSTSAGVITSCGVPVCSVVP